MPELTSEERSRMWPVLDEFVSSLGHDHPWGPNGLMLAKWWSDDEDCEDVPEIAAQLREHAEDFMVKLCEVRHEKSPDQLEEELEDAIQLSKDMTEERDELRDENEGLDNKVDDLNHKVYNLKTELGDREDAVYNLESEVSDKENTIDQLTDELQAAQETIGMLEQRSFPY